MSKKERDWLRVLERVKKKEITLRQAAQIMVGSYRQCLRRYKRYAQEGAKGLVHRGRGLTSNRAKDVEAKKGIIERYQERYGDFGPTLAAEKLTKEGHEVDHETLRRWLIKEKLWKKKRGDRHTDRGGNDEHTSENWFKWTGRRTSGSKIGRRSAA